MNKTTKRVLAESLEDRRQNLEVAIWKRKDREKELAKVNEKIAMLDREIEDISRTLDEAHTKEVNDDS